MSAAEGTALGAWAASAASASAGAGQAVTQALSEAAGQASSGLASSGFNSVDAVLGVLLLASILIGVSRGFVFEILSLVGWVAAWFGAAWLAPELSPHLPVAEPGTALREGLAFVIGFVACLLAWTLAARLVRLLLHATPLSLPDRLLGAAFGLLRGGVVLLALATLIGFTPLASSGPWRDSRVAGWLVVGLEGLRPLLPPEWSRRLPSQASAGWPAKAPAPPPV